MEKASEKIKGKRGGSTLYIPNLNLGNRYLQMFQHIQKTWGIKDRSDKVLERMITDIYNNLEK